MDLKVLRFKFWKQISPTMNYFQDIGAIKKLKCIFLKKVIVKENLHLTLLTHKSTVAAMYDNILSTAKPAPTVGAWRNWLTLDTANAMSYLVSAAK